MQNLAEVVSPQTRGAVCARVCGTSGRTEGIRKEEGVQSTLFSSLGRKDVISGPVEDDLAVRSTFGTKRNKWRTGVVEGRPQGEGRTHLTVTENSGVPSGPSQLPLGKCGFWVLVLILLLYNLGQVLYFARSHFPKWSNKESSCMTLKIFSNSNILLLF